ncbi:MAG: hypothetical protein JNK63_08810 [Chthonomonas sp.]|nr:hypothetical protein [Chthonomonas sp.]
MRFALFLLATSWVSVSRAALIVSGDEWIIGPQALSMNGPSTTQLIRNIVTQFGGPGKTYLFKTGAPVFFGPATQAAFQAEGITVLTTNAPITPTMLTGVDAVFLHGPNPLGQSNTLTSAVLGGKHVYVAGGVFNTIQEVNEWNAFTTPFGITMNFGVINQPSQPFNVVLGPGGHPLRAGQTHLTWSNGYNLTVSGGAVVTHTSGPPSLSQQTNLVAINTVPEPASLIVCTLGIATLLRRRRAC